jgi:hypothetical protein
MTIRFSTALRNAIAGSVGFQGALTKGVIEIYTGPQPLSADAAISGTLLGVVTTGGLPVAAGNPANGLNFEPAVGGVTAKAAADVWSFAGLAEGTAGWFRFKGNAVDSGTADSGFTHPRMDGTCGTSGADLNISNIQVVTGAPNTIDVFGLTFPAQ